MPHPQVLQQLRGQYTAMQHPGEAAACEAKIDRLCVDMHGMNHADSQSSGALSGEDQDVDDDDAVGVEV